MADPVPEGRPWLLGHDAAPIPPAAPGAPFDLVLLDRDGTLNVRRPGYVRAAGELRLIPGAADAVARLNAAGARAVLVTNQRGLARGLLAPAELAAVHAALLRRLARRGARLDGIEVCPHEEGTCGCRKPAPGLLLRALDRAPWASPQRCLMVGDQPSDLAAAAAAGVPARQVGPGAGTLARTVAALLGDRPTGATCAGDHPNRAKVPG